MSYHIPKPDSPLDMQAKSTSVPLSLWDKLSLGELRVVNIFNHVVHFHRLRFLAGGRIFLRQHIDTCSAAQTSS